MRTFILLAFSLILCGCNKTNTFEDQAEPSVSTKDEKPAATEDIAELESQAIEAYENQNWQVAEINYIKLSKLKSESSKYWFYLGNIYSSTNKNELAINAYRQAILRNKNNIRAWNNLGVRHLHQATLTFLSMKDQLNHDDPMIDRIDNIINKITDLINNEFAQP